MAEAVVSFVAVRLGYFIQEAKFLYGVGDIVDFAQTELQFMRSFLKDADKRQEHDETLRIWIAKIVDAAYDLEDVVEAYTLKAVLKRRGGITITLKRFSCILKEGVDLHKIGTEIENITTRISNLRSSLETFNLREIREDGGAGSLQLYERQHLLRRSYSHVIEPDIVGLEDSAKEVIMQLMKEDKCLVVSIWGKGGLGKTTLAKHVYHHSEVRHHFVGFAWVCVSQRCQVRSVWEAILFKLMSPTTEQREAIAKWRDDEIAQKICLTLQDSRCLVVLDDIWSIEAWESLKAAFPHGGTKSRILLTTRKKAVALCADRNGFLYQPRPLNENESWELLSKIAIAGKDDTNSRSYAKKKELGKKMLHHCGGLPLAITVLAGLLVRKDTENEWDMMLKNAEEYIRRGEGHEEEYAGSLWILKLSYDDLPYYLKLCFLYLAHFPEDSSIPVKRLTQLGRRSCTFHTAKTCRFIGNNGDVSYSCFNELVERCMVQVGDQGSIRKIKTCHLHDLLRDLCLLKAGEENFLQIVNFSHRNEAMYLFSSSTVTKVASTDKVRRLAVYLEGSADKLVPSRDESNVHIRSLSYFTPVDWTPRNIKLLRPIFKDFKLLRVLKLENMKRVVELSRDIGSLIHLRFLSLFNSDIRRLPSSIDVTICFNSLF
ncbi:putative disease resistance protein At1g50180 isoform X2 [Malus domestica]|uniref:putative disease resistance protein At1g50180 isoform X2 n=1 Tax=Malus domestica TaxID=3750 RepID=UPI0039755AA6